MKHLSGGDLLRSQITAGTKVGLVAKTFMDKGNLVPDDVVSSLIVNELKGMKEHSWLLDGKYSSILTFLFHCLEIIFLGFPRTLKQAETLYAEEKVDAVISLDVPEGLDLTFDLL